MTDQNAIPAEKVRELAAKYDGDMPTDAHFLLGEIKADLRALLPTQQPTTGLLGRWAKHPEHGDVVCMWDRPDPEGKMHVRWVDESFPMSTGRYYVPLSDLTFPEQATKPEDVPAGEAWLVDVEDSEESHKSIVALKYACDDWRTSDGVTNCIFWQDSEVTLLAPLTPERPGKDDLQAKYDALEDKYREAVEYIAELKPANLHPPFGTKTEPAWRIEHSPDNLRVGEYIIDIDGDDGAVTHEWRGRWDTDGEAYGAPPFAPFIVFPSKDAATPEAILEAKKARGKEMEK